VIDSVSPPQTIFPVGAATTRQVLPGDTLSITTPIGASPGKVVVTALFSDAPARWVPRPTRTRAPSRPSSARSSAAQVRPRIRATNAGRR
jgi:hypothetical protein